ncbi:MAG: UvrD-helicase domain-containing protein [Candidatus Cryptobacteroides sp.]|nr:UvrD-helicase domain-containing protein [Candidatus Cryptobacteroides sp.]
MIKILKASAGSGKTWNLAKTYIELLLKNDDPYAYRHILAVTFTNKATDEMKGRILKELHTLASDTENSSYLKEFVPSKFQTKEALRDKSAAVLYNILHDYSAFAISTIDRFFQQSLKSFSREIGQFSNYQVELDKDSLVEESVDRILDSLSELQPELLRWVSDSVMERLERGQKYSLKDDLLNMASQLESDEHRAVTERYGVDDSKAYSKENLKRMKVVLRKVMLDFRRGLKDAVQAVKDAFLSAGVDPGVTSRSFMSKTLEKFDGMDPYGGVPGFTDSFRCKAQDFQSWFKKADVEKYASLEGVLLPPVQHLIAYYDGGIKAFNTAAQIEDQINDLGIANELSTAFMDVMREHNVICIEESNVLLKNIIDGSDAPFVYEKIGVRYEHFLLDEFQDTSRIQWENFHPLIANSNSQNLENLLVGDVKQSIYRWRGSDWNLMAREVQAEFPNAQPSGMTGNWRSLRNIVEFNNAFFRYAAKAIDEVDGSDPAKADSVSAIYGGLEQEVRTKDIQEGSVEIVFCNSEEELPRTLETINKVLGAGAKLGDIAVLVRNNQEGSKTAAYLIENGLDVISDDSLNLKSSSVVRKLASLISAVNNPEDKIGSYIAEEAGLDARNVQFHSLLELCEILLRKIREKMSEADFEDEVLYIQSFMDYAQDFAATNGNSLNAFLKQWGEDSPKVSSPRDENAVRVMTIHKSKGLEFPYVIFPFAEKVGLFRSTNRWIVPRVNGTPLEGIGKVAFNFALSSGSSDTIFEDDYKNEVFLQHVDNINTFYVALTRASKGLTVIAESGGTTNDGSFKSLAGILESFMDSDAQGFTKSSEGDDIIFMKGAIYDFSKMDRDGEKSQVRNPGFPSFPLDFGEGGGRGDLRLRLSMDSSDFFTEEAKARDEAVRNGTVLHNILASVITPGDVQPAVEKALQSGDVDVENAEADMKLLKERIAAHPEWFPEKGAEIFTETSIFDADGEEHRPDRVIIRDGMVAIVDYKFGEKNPRYKSQMSKYMNIYKRMGYSQVEGTIWYVPADEVE